ncbi:hypothetical protein CLV80_108117 [Yoonia maritima]|uniref:Uncharacterized protein n=1 Tax=Yoonia maritima TaxID=1435347 RepID=A0A2T0VXB2_9RHOB|nr:hypothetical protein CLV80_108117 [Yoonia maritima]
MSLVSARAVLPRCDLGPAFSACDRLGREQSYEAQFCEDGHSVTETTQGGHSSYGSRQSVLFARLPEDLASARQVQTVLRPDLRS